MNCFFRYPLTICVLLAGVLPVVAQESAKPAAPTTAPTTAPAPPPPPTAILEAIPDNASAFVAVRNGQQLNDKIVRILRQLGLDKMLPIPQPIDLLKDYTGIGQGFQSNGAIGVAIMPFDEVEALPQHMALFFPTTNLETMIAGMTPQPIEGEKGMWQVNLLGEPSVVGRKNNFAVIGPSKEIVRAIVQSKTKIITKIKPDRVAAFEKSDAMVWADGASSAKIIKAAMTWFGEMQADQGGAVTNLAGLDDLLKHAEDVDTVSAYLRLGDRGIGVQVHADIKPGTALSKLAASQKSSAASLLVGLPDERFVVAGGQMRSELGTVLGMSSLGALFEMEPVRQMTDPEKLGIFREKLNAWVDLNESVSFSLSVLPEGAGGMIGAVVVSKNADAQKWNNSFIDLIEAGKAMVKAEELGQFLSLIEIKRDAEKIGDVSVHHLLVDISKVEELPEGQVALLKKLLGEEGLLIRLAAVGSDRNVLAFGGGKARMEKILALVGENGAPLSENVGVKLVSKVLPKERYSEVYISIDALSHLAKTFLDLYGMGDMLPVQIPQINAPIALVGSGGGDHLQVDFLLPMEVVVAVKDMALGALGGMMPNAAPAP